MTEWKLFRVQLSQLVSELAGWMPQGWRIHSLTALPLPALPGRDVEILVVLQR
jgi:hypothetical protein